MAKTSGKDTPWIVLQCDACDGKFKVRKDEPIRGRLKCPSCSEIVLLDRKTKDQLTFVTAVEEPDELISQVNPEIEEEENEIKALDDGFKQKLKSTEDVSEVVERKVTETDRESQAVESDDDVPEGMERRRRKKRKKRRKKQAIDWEEDRKEGEGGDPDWEEEWTHAVGLEEDGDGNVLEHRRTTKRRKDLSPMGRFLARINESISTILTVVIVFVLVVAVVSLYSVLTTDRGPDLDGSQIEIRGVVTHELKDAALRDLSAYLVAETIDERLALVRAPRRVEPFMRAFHAAGIKPAEIGPNPKVRRAYIRCEEDAQHSDFFFILVEFAKTFESQIFALEHRDGKFLVDWETSYGHEVDPLHAFRAARDPTRSAVFRCTITPNDLYTNAFDDESEYTCFLMNFPQGTVVPSGTHGSDPFNLFGYVRKNTPMGAKIKDLFVGEEDAAMKVKLNAVFRIQYPDPVVSPNQVEITEVVNTSWFYADSASGKKFAADAESAVTPGSAEATSIPEE